MDRNGKAAVKDMLSKIKPGGSTNIGSGIYTALKVLNDRRQRNPVSSVLLLGDG
jgi:Mg-chelatase subunit ChlD